MKKIETMKEYCEEIENYRLSVTPYELHLIKLAVVSYIIDLEIEVEEYDWGNTPDNHEKIFELQNLLQSINDLPF